jgi:hypothetical protein
MSDADNVVGRKIEVDKATDISKAFCYCGVLCPCQVNSEGTLDEDRP